MQFLKVAKDAVCQTEFAKEMQGTVSKSNTRRCFNRVQFLKVMQVALSKEGGTALVDALEGKNCFCGLWDKACACA